MLFFIEAAVLCALFTLIIVPAVYHDPLSWAEDYPPKVTDRARALGYLPAHESLWTPKVLLQKGLFCVFAVTLLTCIVHFLNGADSFLSGFLLSYGLWLSVTWYDGLILDCLWFCHSQKVRLPGTEDMDREYRDYGFHLRQSLIGCGLGLPVCLLAGAGTVLLTRLF